MIKTQELRIGNWLIGEYGLLAQVLYATNGSVCLISPTSKERLYVKVDPIVSGDLYNVKPVPLTPEILEKCGFEEGMSKWYNKKYFTDCKESSEVMEIQINIKSFRCGIADTDFGGTNAMTGKRIEYLHQLQNLYYSLCGEELIYTP